MLALLAQKVFVWQGLNQFIQDIVGLFAILNPLGNLPIFLGLTREATIAQRRRMFRLATITGSVIVACMAIAGQFILDNFFQVSTDELRFGGGLLLITIGALGIIHPEATRPASPSASNDPAGPEGNHLYETHTRLAISPIASPLLVGPGSIVVVMLIAQQSGAVYALLVSSICFFAVALILHWAHWGYKLMGPTGTLAVGRVMQIFIVAIGVHFIFTSIRAVFLNQYL
jgi:multiple antibiotic resistance protein